MSWYDAYWPALVETISVAWPEIGPGEIFIDTTLERLDWINLLNANRLGPQWVSVRLTIEDADDWNPDWPCYSVVAAIHYIALSSTAATETLAGPAPTITEYLAQKAAVFRTEAFRAESLGTVLTSAPLSLSADDPVNVVLLDAKIPIQSIGVTISSIVVDISEYVDTSSTGPVNAYGPVNA